MGFFDLCTLVSDRSAMPGIYVERRVRGSVDEVWRLTQTPEVHQRWDLRFTEIRYLLETKVSRSGSCMQPGGGFPVPDVLFGRCRRL